VANVCGGTGTGSTTVSFEAGALIIPMDQCYNPSQASAPIQATDFGSTGACGTTTAPTCYAPTTYTVGDIRLPFGVLYLLAINHIPVNVINKPTKINLTDYDITVTPPSGSTTNTVAWLDPNNGYAANLTAIPSGTNPVSYWGMPFVVEASFASQAVALIQDFNANPTKYGGVALATNGKLVNSFATVPLHVVNYPFSAPVMGIIGSRPKPVGISQTNFFDSFFDESGITAVVPAGTSAVHLTETSTPPGTTTGLSTYVSTYTYPWAAPLPQLSECPASVCPVLLYSASGVTQRILDVIWSDDIDLQFWTGANGLTDWFTNGGRALIVGSASGGGGALSWETGDNTSKNFLSTGGLGGAARSGGNYCAADTDNNGNGIVGPPTDYPASDVYLQLGGLLEDPIGGGQSADYSFQTKAAAPGTTGLWGDSNEFAVVHGHPIVGGVSTSGSLVYEGASTAWHGGSGRKDSGLHIMYNTLIADTSANGTPYTPTELTRSSPIGRTTGEYYIGTFEWKIPTDPNAAGDQLYQADPTKYPYTVGHFREYRSINTTSPLAQTCSLTDPTVGCRWDLGDGSNVPAWSSRNVYVGKSLGGGAWTLQTAASLASDATLTFVKNNIGQKLGGVDYNNPAVIEGKGALSLVTVANAGSRPTVAYVGARDGMLHAVCVAPASGATDCYGFQPGQEIWALIPAGEKALMDIALAAGDWSKVNVGGTVRVADMFGTFPSNGSATTSPSYRTILLVGTRGSGHVVALDISNPDPANLNKDGFQLMWEQDGTDVDTGVNAYRMGRTHGATIAQNGTGGVALVSASVASGAGINTYALRLTDGKVISSTQRLYTRVAPITGGSTATMTNDVPALPTVLDTDGDGRDETVLTAAYDGLVRKFTLDNQNVYGATPLTLFDTAGNGVCATGIACQPIGVSPTIARRQGIPTFTAFVGTGGADWDASTTRQSYVFGFDPSSSTQASSVFTQQLGSVTPPSPANLALPVRVYSQLTVAGSDLYAQATVLGINSTSELIVPVMYPGTYGTVLRWGGLESATIDSVATAIVKQGDIFSGGMGGVLETNNTSNDGALTILGTQTLTRIALPSNSTSLRNNAYAVVQLPAGQRPFSVMTWFDLID
jgi:hypothetical protein